MIVCYYNNMIKFTLTLETNINLNGESVDRIEEALRDIIREANINGKFTGDSAATVDSYLVSVSVSHPSTPDDEAEQQRRDEKNGLYPQYTDPAN